MGKVVIFSTGAKGGVGKSTMAILMVEALREAGVSVAGIEGDEHSPSLVRKYGGAGRVRVGEIDLAALVGAPGAVAFNSAVEAMEAEYLVVNAPASGARIFEEVPEALAAASWGKRAAWCLAINADRSGDGIEDDGLLQSMDRGMLAVMDPGGVTVVRPLFQASYRGQPFWFDKLGGLAGALGVNEMGVASIHAQMLEAIHRDRRPMGELIAALNKSDPMLGATLQMFWHATKADLARTVLAGVELPLGDSVKSPRGRLFGPGGLMSQASARPASAKADEDLAG